MENQSGAQLSVPIVLLDPGLSVPEYAHTSDAGVDLQAREDAVIEPGGRVLIPTGISIALPDGFVGLVHPRSGLAAKHGITVLNAPGTVDAGYRGEIKVTLLNTDKTTSFTVSRGDRIAQLLVQRVEHLRFAVVSALPDSSRGDSGFGSSGGFSSPQ